MKNILREVLAGLGFLLAVSAADAQTLICFKSATGSGCTPVSAGAPLPISGTINASTSATASATLPTLVAGSGKAVYESLSGALFIQPVFGTTLVDITHGLPVNVVAGGAGGGAVFGSTANASPAANPPVLLGGTADGTATGNVGNWKVNSSGLGFVSAIIPSGGIASGGIASGAIAAGAVAAGAGVDGWDLTQGAIADAAVTAGATGSISAKLRAISRDIAAAIPDCGATPCTNKIGVVGVNTWGGSLLGAMANYGTSPGAVLVPGVNAFITNTVPVSSTTLATAANQATEITSLATIATNTGAAIPAGSALIGGVKIFDGGGTNQATVKAASTAAATADTSITVQLNPVQPNLTTPLNVSLAANQSVNTAQVNGVTTLTGTGATGTGAQRVTVATDQATNAGAALVKGGVGTVNGGSDYETVAASQTAQALGATGATGDYLSHCVLQPTTTAAGTMTILDNATVIFTFTTGTLSNLAPIAIPIGANSVSGAWKVTTGANETATCFGKFT